MSQYFYEVDILNYFIDSITNRQVTVSHKEGLNEFEVQQLHNKLSYISYIDLQHSSSLL